MTQAIPDTALDLLATLRDQQTRGVPVRLTRPPRWAEPCTACPADAVAYVEHRAPDVLHPRERQRYLDPTCAEHLHDVVTHELDRKSQSIAVVAFAPGLAAEVAA